MQNLEWITVFVTAVDAGSFSAAAARLNLSRSAVGKTIARLESRLGVRLFQRSTRTRSLTHDGQLFYEHCVRGLEEIRIGEALLDAERKEISGRLRVTMPVILGRRCAAPILTRLAAQHPKLLLDLQFTDRLIDLVEDGFDLAVRTGSLGDSPDLVGRPLSRQRMVVCAAPNFVEKHGFPKSAADLARFDAVRFNRDGRLRGWFFPNGENPPIEVMPRTRARFDDLEATMDAAIAGMGLAWLPSWLIKRFVLAGSLMHVLPQAPSVVTQNYALWPKSPHLPMRTRLAVDTLLAELPVATDQIFADS
jgi:DNA-binding transcriptional LysR family regulator